MFQNSDVVIHVIRSMTGASAHEWGSKGVPNSQLMPKPQALRHRPPSRSSSMPPPLWDR